MRVGILTNELFDQRLGRMGGFGWAARESIRFTRPHSDCHPAVTVPRCPHFNLARRSSETTRGFALPPVSFIT